MRANDMLAQGTLFRAVLSALNTGYDIARDYCANPRHSDTQQTRNEVLLNPTHLPDEFKTRAFISH